MADNRDTTDKRDTTDNRGGKDQATEGAEDRIKGVAKVVEGRVRSAVALDPDSGVEEE